LQLSCLTNPSASDTPTKTIHFLQARPKTTNSGKRSSPEQGFCVCSVGTHLLLPPSYHYTCTQFSPACTACLLQREPTAAITSKSDFTPPRQPNENNKSLIFHLPISACVSPNLQSPCCCTGSFVPVSIKGQYPDLYNQYSFTTTIPQCVDENVVFTHYS